MSNPSDWTRGRQLVMAHWQDGLVAGLLSAANIAERNGDLRLAQDIRDTAVHYVTNIATELPIEAYMTPEYVA